MLKVLLSVDGSMSATHATQKLVETLELYNEQPEVDVLAVHLPVPRYGISDDTRERYYQEECEGMLAACKKILDAAGVKYTVHTCVGEIAESIIEQATKSRSNMIYMGTRGRTALSNLVLGSVTTRVLHLTHIPVVLIH